MQSPLQAYLADLHAGLAGLDDGAVATYIPELAKADPRWFGICVVTMDGVAYAAGDVDPLFTFQSISKAFTYATALADRGQAFMYSKVGVEPSGDAFNSISLDPQTGAPLNPMINAGAIATTSLVAGETVERQWQRIAASLGTFAGRAVAVDDAVYRSESVTGFRNRAIAWMLKNFGIIDGDPMAAVENYFRQCSVLVNCRDLAYMAATLANDGVHPRTGQRAMPPGDAEQVLSVMATCGMYDYAGSWLYEVGMPAKKRCGRRDHRGGAGALRHRLLLAAAGCQGQQRARHRGVRAVVARLRTPRVHAHRQPVDGAGARLHRRRGALAGAAAGSAARGAARARRLHQVPVPARLPRPRRRGVCDSADGGHGGGHVELHPRHARGDRRVGERGTAIERGAPALRGTGHRGGVLAGARAASGYGAAQQGGAQGRPRVPRVRGQRPCGRVVREPHCAAGAGDDLHASRLGAVPQRPRQLLAKVVEASMAHAYAAGDQILRHGQQGNGRVFFIESGRVSVLMPLPNGAHQRLASLGPGMEFGEMALLGQTTRSASVFADTAVRCRVLEARAFDEITAAAPELRIAVLENLANEMAARLRGANQWIAALA